MGLFRLVFGSIVKPLQALGQLLDPKRSTPFTSSSLTVDGGFEEDEDLDHHIGGVTHHLPLKSQVLKNFNEIRFLRIELTSYELGIDDGVLLKWRADFRTTLEDFRYVIYPSSEMERGK